MMTTTYGRFMDDLRQRMDRIGETMSELAWLIRHARRIAIGVTVVCAAIGLVVAVWKVVP